ncbi:hypothetical protein [Bacillus cabrialesii]|nr:hypothetical protein [Bacillus cabrialesii]MDU0153961.1 hypothetical protein [Bacillus cabrialesii]
MELFIVVDLNKNASPLKEKGKINTFVETLVEVRPFEDEDKP